MKKERQAEKSLKVPTILCDPATWESFKIFNPNDWIGQSKNVINSAGSQYGLILYQTRILKELYLKSDMICLERYREFQLQWNQAKWDIAKGLYLVDIPAVHLNIQTLFSTVKTYLDLLVQLVSTESIVSQAIDGFHKSGDVVGGRFLNTLKNNVTKGKNRQAKNIFELVIKHKSKWIDEVVKHRDVFTHPVKGLRTVMFELILNEDNGKLILVQIIKPSISNKIFDTYAENVVNNINEFTNKYIYLTKNA